MRVGQLSFCSQVAPWHPSHAGAANASHAVFPRTVKLKVGAHPHQSGKFKIQGQGVPNHQMLPISGAQRFQAFWLLRTSTVWLGTVVRGQGRLVLVGAEPVEAQKPASSRASGPNRYNHNPEWGGGKGVLSRALLSLCVRRGGGGGGVLTPRPPCKPPPNVRQPPLMGGGIT